MRAFELYERALPPKKDLLIALDIVLEKTRTLYRSTQRQEAAENPDYDASEFDMEVWESALIHITREEHAPFVWNVSGTDQGSKPVSMFLHSGHANDDGTITFNLYAPHMEDGLDYKIFKMVLMRFIEHEAVHMSQRDKMGHDTYANRYTGFQRAGADLSSPDEDTRKKGMRTYLSDPQEIMAHARDLYNEAKALGDPMKVLQNPDANAQHLPTWQKFMNAGMSRTDRRIKRLLKYAVSYIDDALDEMYKNIWMGNQRINETFDQPYSYTWDYQSNGAWRGHFIIKTNDEVDVAIEHWQKYWKIEFSRNRQHVVTGGGDAMRIFSTVSAMIDEFIDIQSPEVIKFSADKSETGSVSRAKLYSKIIKRFASANGYDSQESTEDGKTSYLLTRKEDNKSLEESGIWDLDGFWITETGKKLDINHDEENHHATIALDTFSNVDLSDVNLSDEDAENAVDAAMIAAYNNGWIRVSTSPQEVAIDFFKLNRSSLSSLKKHLADYPWPKYSFSHNQDLNTSFEYGEVESFKELFNKLAQILVKNKS